MRWSSGARADGPAGADRRLWAWEQAQIFPTTTSSRDKGYHQSTNSKRRLTRSRQMRRGQFARLLLGAVASCLLRAAEGVSYHNTSYSFGRCYGNERQGARVLIRADAVCALLQLALLRPARGQRTQKASLPRAPAALTVKQPRRRKSACVQSQLPTTLILVAKTRPSGDLR